MSKYNTPPVVGQDDNSEKWNTQSAYLTALDAAERLHWSVVPLNAEKKPPTKWKQYQSTAASAQTITDWQNKFNPQAWAVVTGKVSGIITLDFDGEQGCETLAQLGLNPHRRTGGGGFHVDFKHPGWHVKTLNHETSKDRPWAKQYPSLDIRADGGYVAFCGHNQKGPYLWLRDPEPEELDVLPADLREMLGLLHAPQRGRPAVKPKSNEDAPVNKQLDRMLSDALARCAEDGRNNAGFLLARMLRRAGVPFEGAREVMREFQKRVPETDGHGEVTPYTIDEAMNSLQSAYEGSLPMFAVGKQLREEEAHAVNILEQANRDDPKLFVYMQTLSKVAKDEHGKPIIMQMDRARMKHELSLCADFYHERTNSMGQTTYTPIHPPQELAEQILAMEPSAWPFPALKAIVETPVIRPDGSILDTHGYDEKTKLYYIPSENFEACRIPDKPTQADAIEAMERLKKIFVDFPFEGEADRANMLGLLFTPFVRSAVKEDTQAALIDATNPGTGKTLLADIVSIVSTGEKTTPINTKGNEDEWRKSLFAELLRSPRIIKVDNVRGVLESMALETILTGKSLNDRILGQSKNIDARSEATVIVTGNNLLVGGDLPRRCYRIRLIAPTATPDERPEESYETPRLEEWVTEHRAEVVRNILIVARAWFVAGKPKPADTISLGSFTDWARTIGGMLEFAGVKGFQQNRDELRNRNSEEAAECEAFLSAWRDEFGEEWVKASTVAEKIQLKIYGLSQPPANGLFDTLPNSLKNKLDKPNSSFEVSLSYWLAKRVQTKYGTPPLSIEKEMDRHSKVSVWRVVRGVAVPHFSHAGAREKKENTFYDNAHNFINMRVPTGDGDNPTQPPARPEITHVARSDKSLQSITASQATLTDCVNVENGLAGGCENGVNKKNDRGFHNGTSAPNPTVAAVAKAIAQKGHRQLIWRVQPNAGGWKNGYVSVKEYLKRLEACLESPDSSVRGAADDEVVYRMNER